MSGGMMQQGRAMARKLRHAGLVLAESGLVKRLSAQVQRSAQSRVSEMWSRNDDFGLEQSHGDRVLMFLRPMH